MRAVDLCKKYLPLDVEFSVQDSFCLLMNPEKKIVFGYSREVDERLAKLNCLWSALEASERMQTEWVERISDSQLWSSGFSCAATLAQAEERVLRKTVRRWVMHNWLNEGRGLAVDGDLQQALKKSDSSDLRAFHQVVSYFEPKTGIHHHHFVAIVGSVANQMRLGAGVAREKRQAYELALSEFDFRAGWSAAWHWPSREKEQEIVLALSRQGDFLNRLCSTGAGDEWPGLRVDFAFREFREEESLGLCWAWPNGVSGYREPYQENLWML